MQKNQNVDFNQKLEVVLDTENYYHSLVELLGDYRIEYKEVIQILASAHNSGKLDVLKFLNSPQCLDGNISHIRPYLGVIGLIEAPAKSVFETSQRILSKGEYCNIPISEFLGVNKSRIKDAVEMLAKSPTKWEFFFKKYFNQSIEDIFRRKLPIFSRTDRSFKSKNTN